MEDTNQLFEVKVEYNDKIISKYIKTLLQRFYVMISMLTLFALMILLLALLNKNNNTFEWIAFVIILLCGGALAFINISGVRNCKFTMKKYLGNIYHFTFYQNHFVVEYLVKKESFIEDYKYTDIRSAMRNNGLLVVIMLNNELLFIDEEQIPNFYGYNEIVDLISKNSQLQSTKRKNRKNAKK